jgi:phosphatidylinositol glycan class B
MIAFVVYAVSAFHNTGFYYYDEHYQIIEFAELKSGRNNPSDLAWEYKEKIRPAIQPLMAFIGFSLMRGLGVQDSYVLITILRLFTALLALAIITFFVNKTKHLLPANLESIYRFISYFLWFIPFLNIRFSSEAYSGLSFILAVALIYTYGKHRYLLIGCLLGLSFIFRYQTIFMSVGFVLWMAIIQKVDFKSLLRLFAGSILVLILGFGIDYWFYQTSTSTFVNYFIANIIEQKMVMYGVSPWHLYFTSSLNAMTFPIAIIIWVSVTEQLICSYKSWLPWVILPFLIFHICVSHKEMRFLFPLVNFVPLTIMLALKDLLALRNTVVKNAIVNYTLYVVVFVSAITNVVALAMVACSPADGTGRMNITQTIRRQFQGKKVFLWTVDTPNPYRLLVPKQKFYRDTNVTVFDWNFRDQINYRPDAATLVVVKSDEIDDYEYLIPYRLEIIVQGVPQWVERIKRILGYDTNSLSLYRVTSVKK